MFSYKSKLLFKNAIVTKLFKTSQFSFNFSLMRLSKKHFNTPVPAGAAGVAAQGAQAPPKTKEQLKVEKLMESWPESVRNPKTEEMQLLKETLEYVYKFHQGDKPYIKYHELPEHITRTLVSQIFTVMSTENIAGIFKDQNGFIPDEMIAFKFNQICITHQDLTKEFYDTILPEMKKCIANSDRQCNNILALALTGGAHAHIADKEFWGLLEHKLVNERLYRYLTLEQQVNVAFYLSISGHKWTTLLKALEVNFIKHRRALSHNQRMNSLVDFTYKFNGLGTELLFKALEDPTIQVPGVDAKFPMMERTKNMEIGLGDTRGIEHKNNH